MCQLGEILDEAAWREKVSAAVRQTLDDAALSPSPYRLHALRRDLEAEGARLFESQIVAAAGEIESASRGRACFSLRITSSTLHRVLGFGAWQARCLGGEAAAIPGALFNLGIVLFDAILDRGDSVARGALERLTVADFVSGSDTRAPPEVIFLRQVSRCFFSAAGAAAAPALLARLLAAELRAADLSHASPRTALRSLRTKSVEPFLLLARLGGDSAQTQERRARARGFGRAVWIVDDLWDAVEDDTAQAASRLWCPGMSGTASAPRSLPGVLNNEARRLRTILREAQNWDEDTRECLAVTLASWVEMARPQPLFACPDKPSPR